METPHCSVAEAERLKRENDMLRKRVRMLAAELDRLKAKLINTWGEA